MKDRQSLLNEVQKERDMLSALISSIPDEVWFADNNKKFTLLNQSALQEFGLYPSNIDVEELASNLEVYRSDGSPRPVEEAPPLRALKGEIVKNLEEIIRTPSRNELRYRQVNASPVKDSDDNIIGSVAVVRDITESKKTEKCLKESELKYHSLFDNIPLTTNLMRYVLNDNGEVVDWVFEDMNLMTQELLGYSKEKLKGKSLMNLMGRNHIASFLPIVNEIRKTGKVARQESHLDAMDMYHITTFAPLNNDQFLTIDQDITARKNARCIKRK